MLNRRPLRFWAKWVTRVTVLLLVIFLQVTPFVYASSAGAGTSGLPPPATASTETPVQLAAKQYSAISNNAIESAWNALVVNYGGFLPTDGTGQFVSSFMPGANGLQYSNIGTGMFRFLLQALWQDARLFGTLLILAALISVLETMQTAFASEMVGKVAFLVVHLVLLVLAVTSFRDATQFASGAIDTMTSVMLGSLPVVMALISASGGLTSAATFHPLIVFIVNAMGFMVQKWVFPIIFFSAVLMIVSTISSRYKLTELAGFMRSVTVFALGLAMSTFLGVMSIQGSIAGIADGVTLRSAKFVASTFVPILGKPLSDASATIAGASLIVKNATGMASAIVLLLICAFPALKILALSIVYNGSAALMQPLGDSPIVKSLSTIGKSFALIFAALVVVGLMFFFSMVITIAATNLTAFVR